MKNSIPYHLSIICKDHKFGKIFFIVERASQHTSKDAKRYLRNNKNVKLAYLSRTLYNFGMIKEIWRQYKHDNTQSEFKELIYEMRYTVMEECTSLIFTCIDILQEQFIEKTLDLRHTLF